MTHRKLSALGAVVVVVLAVLLAGRSRDDLSCYVGSGEGCYAAAGQYEVRGQHSAAVRRYERACGLGVASGCAAAGWAYSRGSGAPRNVVVARALLQKACDADNADSCGELGRLLRSSSQPNEVPAALDILKKAAGLYQKECERGVAAACVSLALAQLDGEGVPLSGSASLASLGRACELGDKVSCQRAARGYLKGRTTPRDPTVAARYYERACVQHGAAADCCALASLYRAGMVKAPSRIQISHLLERACAGGEVHACIALWAEGESSELGPPSRRFAQACDEASPPVSCDSPCVADEAKRRELAVVRDEFEQLCDRGNGKACLASGAMLSHSVGAESDPVAALVLLRKSCDLGNATGCEEAGLLLSLGAGVPKDTEEARRYRRRACELGLKGACSGVVAP